MFKLVLQFNLFFLKLINFIFNNYFGPEVFVRRMVGVGVRLGVRLLVNNGEIDICHEFLVYDLILNIIEFVLSA